MSHNAFSGRHNCESCCIVLSIMAKELTQSGSLVDVNCTQSKPLVSNVEKSFLLLFTVQLNSLVLLFFLPPASTHFHTDITSYYVYFRANNTQF